jgi:Fuc2NAc and GlcNAc transferase
MLFASCFGIAALLTYVVRRYAIARMVLDTPNERSLHATPTPRGGGFAIATTFLTATLLLCLGGIVPVAEAVALIGGGGAVALIGWLDDHAPQSAALRFSVHALAAIWALFWLGGIDAVQFGAHYVRLAWLWNVIGVLGIIWWLNLYNFMDGIDGIAGGEAVSVCSGVVVLMALVGTSSERTLPIVLAGSAAGFLIFNWSPARIFMGDVGSGFLGYVFAVMAIASEKDHAVPLTLWVVLSGVFIFDATVTLVRRMLHGERWYAAHRSHAYQRLVGLGYSHRLVSSAVLAVNAVLLGCCVLAVTGRISVGVCIVASLALLSGCYFWIEHRNPMQPAVARAKPARPASAVRADQPQ